jgi:hypothetical protein
MHFYTRCSSPAHQSNKVQNIFLLIIGLWLHDTKPISLLEHSKKKKLKSYNGYEIHY